MPKAKYILYATDRVGAADAVEDKDFLRTCFVDSGYLDVLGDTTNHQGIVLGRTGAGKSALLDRLLETKGNRARRFLPKTLALQYLSDSPLLRRMHEMEVNFDLFFNLLWKHVFAVELIRWRYEIETRFKQQSVTQKILSTVNPTLRRAFEYLHTFGDSFWMESSERVIGFTQHFEREIREKAGNSIVFMDAVSSDGRDQARELNEERYGSELRAAAQQVIGSIQRHHLAETVNLVKSVLRDDGRPDNKWYIVIDELDENWVDDRFKAQLIRALLDAIRDFNDVRNLKIVVALRYDLIDRVFKTAIGSGAQQEKYKSRYLHVRWSRPALTQALDKRLNQIMSSRYEQDEVLTHKDFFPREVTKNQEPMSWILDRTLRRPRDVIEFVNLCLSYSDRSSMISARALQTAEGDYSRSRLTAIFAEWEIDYPNLGVFVDLLKRRPMHFEVKIITDDELIDFIGSIAEAQANWEQPLKPMQREDVLSAALKSYERKMDGPTFRRTLFSVFYQVGLVGLKVSDGAGYSFSYDGEVGVSKAEINDTTRVAIHPCFLRALGIGRADVAEALA